MAKTIALAANWFDTLEIDSSTNKIAIAMSNAELVGTTFADSAVRRYAGLGDSSISLAGFVDWPDPDNTAFNDVGNLIPVSVAMGGNAIGNVAYFINAEASAWQVGAKIGDLYAFTLKAASTDLLFNGFLAQTGNVTANGSSPVYQFPAPATNLNAIGAAIHVTGFGGTAPTLAVILQSAATAGFGSPTTRATFNVVNGAVASQILKAVGPITDQYWRLSWTIGGSGGPNFTFAGVIGNGS